MKNIKAELTTKQIVILVILIASFAIILFFLFRLNLGQESEKQLCYNSVMNRATLIRTADDLVSDSIPLNCQRSYVCITKDGSCEQMLDPIKKKVKTKEDVYQVLGDELADCWWMFGEGKVEYLEKESFSNLYCSICSQISFDDSVKDIFGSNEFNKRDVFEYLSRTKLKDQSGPTYLEYLYFTNDATSLLSQGVDFGPMYLDKQYYSLMGSSSDISTLSWVTNIAIGGAVVLGGLALVPLTGGSSAVVSMAVLTTVLKAGVIGAAAGGVAGGTLVAPVIRNLYGKKDVIPPYLVEAGSKEFEALNCDEITTKS